MLDPDWQSAPYLRNEFFRSKHPLSFYLRDLTAARNRQEDKKGSRVVSRTGTAVDVGNFRGPRCVAADKMLKMCIFVQDDEVNNCFITKKELHFYRSSS